MQVPTQSTNTVRGMRKPITATVEEYRSWVDFILERQAVTTLKAVNEMRSNATKAGAGTGSHVQVRLVEIARDGLDAAIDLALGQYKRISESKSSGDREYMDATNEALRSFVKRIWGALLPKSGAMPGSSEILRKQLPDLMPYLETALHRFDIGLLEVTEPKVPITMTNSIHVGGNVIGSPIQQDADGSSQSTQIAIGDITSSLGELERALSEISIADTERALLAADIKTIRAQLEKPSPSQTILVEAGRSIRSIVENVVASAITPQTLAALSAVTRALGLS